MREQVRKLREDGYTITEIAKELKKSTSTISYHFKKLGLNKEYKNLSNDEGLLVKIKDFYGKGNSLSTTAKKFNISRNTVKKYVDVREPIIKTTEEIRLGKIESNRKRKKKIKLMAVSYKGGCCQECGYHKCNDALEFHHLDPTQKDFEISGRGMSRSWEKVEKELDKCVMLCANCHREAHASIIGG